MHRFQPFCKSRTNNYYSSKRNPVTVFPRGFLCEITETGGNRIYSFHFLHLSPPLHKNVHYGCWLFIVLFLKYVLFLHFYRNFWLNRDEVRKHLLQIMAYQCVQFHLGYKKGEDCTIFLILKVLRETFWGILLKHFMYSNRWITDGF